MNNYNLNNQKNTVTIQESDLNNLTSDEFNSIDFEQGIDFLMNEQGLYEPEEYKQLAEQQIER